MSIEVHKYNIKDVQKKYLKNKKNPEFWRISAPQNVRSEPRFVEFRMISNLRIIKFFAYVLTLLLPNNPVWNGYLLRY